MDGLTTFFQYSGFANITWGHAVMILVGVIFIYLAIRKEYEPLLLIPIGFGIIIGNIPFVEGVGLQLGIYEEGSVLNFLYFGVLKGIYPPLIFMGIGAMTDFSTLLSNPKLMILGAAAQVGIFATFLASLVLGFSYAGIRCNWYHWRCRWSYCDLPCIATCSRPHRINSNCGLFIYGISACDPAAYYQTTDFQKRKIESR
jgi:Na+-transporting methylmalonyl-CoA/oxaloacetate decarboxylase beta subunit